MVYPNPWTKLGIVVNGRYLQSFCAKTGQFLGGALLCLLAMLHGAQAQTEAQKAPMPTLFDVFAQEDIPDYGSLRQIRFLTESDYPPLHFLRSDGELTGFNVDVARALCLELNLQCTVQPWRWDKLNEALASGAGDAIIASVRPTQETAAVQIYSVPYYVTPARFVSLKDIGLTGTSEPELANKTIAVVAGSAHEAYLKRAAPKLKREAVLSLNEAQTALVSGRVDAIFGDGLTLSLWLGQDQGSPAHFVGGAYFDNAFFGEGARIAFRPEDETMRLAVNYGLRKLSAKGVLTALYWKYFPIGFY